MKKLILTAAALMAFAGMSQAASITWGSTDPAQFIRDMDGVVIAPAMAAPIQLVQYSGAYNEETGHYATETVVDSGIVSEGAVVPKGGKYADIYTYVYGATIEQNDTFVIRVFDPAGNIWNSPTFTVSAVDDAGGDSFLLSDYTSSEGYGDWTPIPEPATAGLLAMGLAAVALRRKFRK